MQWADILIGAVLLLVGRRLFWLFVGGVGFLVGFNFAGQALQEQPQWVIFSVAIGVGLVAAIFSIFSAARRRGDRAATFSGRRIQSVGSSLNQKRHLRIAAVKQRDATPRHRGEVTPGPALCVSPMFSGNKEVLE